MTVKCPVKTCQSDMMSQSKDMAGSMICSNGHKIWHCQACCFLNIKSSSCNDYMCENCQYDCEEPETLSETEEDDCAKSLFE